MQDSDDKKPVSLFFQVPGKTAVEFYQLAAEHFGMKKGRQEEDVLEDARRPAEGAKDRSVERGNSGA